MKNNKMVFLVFSFIEKEIGMLLCHQFYVIISKSVTINTVLGQNVEDSLFESQEGKTVVFLLKNILQLWLITIIIDPKCKCQRELL